MTAEALVDSATASDPGRPPSGAGGTEPDKALRCPSGHGPQLQAIRAINPDPAQP